MPKQYEDDEPIILDDRYGVIKTPNKGLSFKKRKELLSEVYAHGFNPDELAASPDYSEIEAQVREILGTPPDSWCGQWWPSPEQFIVREHPHLKRICIFVRQPPQKHTKAPLWYVQSIFWHEPESDDYLPVDYRARPELRHLSGACGDHRYPTARDFELIKEAIVTNFESQDRYEDAIEEASRDRRDQLVKDICDYSFNQERDRANQRAGSGQFMSNAHTKSNTATDSWLPFEDKRYAKLDTGKGYKEKVKVGSQRFIELVLGLVKNEPKLIPAISSTLAANDLETHLAGVLAKLDLEELLGRLSSKVDIETPVPKMTITETVRNPDGTLSKYAKRVKV